MDQKLDMYDGVGDGKTTKFLLVFELSTNLLKISLRSLLPVLYSK